MTSSNTQPRVHVRGCGLYPDATKSAWFQSPCYRCPLHLHYSCNHCATNACACFNPLYTALLPPRGPGHPSFGSISGHWAPPCRTAALCAGESFYFRAQGPRGKGALLGLSRQWRRVGSDNERDTLAKAVGESETAPPRVPANAGVGCACARRLTGIDAPAAGIRRQPETRGILPRTARGARGDVCAHWPPSAVSQTRQQDVPKGNVLHSAGHYAKREQRAPQGLCHRGTSSPHVQGSCIGSSAPLAFNLQLAVQGIKWPRHTSHRVPLWATRPQPRPQQRLSPHPPRTLRRLTPPTCQTWGAGRATAIAPRRLTLNFPSPEAFPPPQTSPPPASTSSVMQVRTNCPPFNRLSSHAPPRGVATSQRRSWRRTGRASETVVRRHSLTVGGGRERGRRRPLSRLLLPWRRWRRRWQVAGTGTRIPPISLFRKENIKTGRLCFHGLRAPAAPRATKAQRGGRKTGKRAPVAGEQ